MFIGILLNLVKGEPERSTRFEFGNFAHGVGIQGGPERSILHYLGCICIVRGLAIALCFRCCK